MRKNFIQKIGYGNVAGLLLIAITVMLGTSIVSFGQFGGTGTTGNSNSSVMNTICNLFNTIKNVIFILGLTLMVLGGAIYAGANLMPSQSRGAFQGYGMAMVIGGIIGVAIAVAAPFILNTVLGAAGSGSTIITSGVTGISGSSLTTSLCSQSGFGGI